MIPIILAGLAGYALSNPRRRRKHRRRRNPEMFKWKISKPILAELFVFEVENIDTEDREGSAKEMALAIEAAGSRGPKTLTLSRAASWDLHDALDNAADIHNDGGYGDQRALARAEAKMRDKIAATLNGASTEPTIAPSKKVPGKFIIGIGGKAIKGADGATLYFGSHADAEKHLTKPNPRRNPLSLDALALPAASLLWRKHGYQSPGHAEDLAMMARRGTAAAKLWARVAQITKNWLYAGKKRSNPSGKKRSNPGGDPKKVFFNDSSKIPPELLRQLQTVKPDHESDDQTNWTLVWDGWEWKATGCSTVATRDKPNLCDLTLEPIWPVSTKKPRGKR